MFTESWYCGNKCFNKAHAKLPEKSPKLPEQTPKLPAGYVAVRARNLDRMSCPFCAHACKGVKGVKIHLTLYCETANALGEFIFISTI